MSRQGRLKLDDYGASMPVTGPAVQKPPFYYRNMRIMFFVYRTDDDAALAWLPEQLELDGAATATVIIAHYGASTFGPYHEAMISLRARMDGRTVAYYPALFTDNEAPLIGGREIWGFAKKLARIELREESEVMMGLVERPTGNRLMTGVMRNETPVAVEDFEILPSVSLKMIPCATASTRPALAQLIGSALELVPHTGSNGIADIWTGPGSLHYDMPSAVGPWYRLPVREMLGCYSGTFDAVLGHGEILREL